MVRAFVGGTKTTFMYVDVDPETREMVICSAFDDSASKNDICRHSFCIKVANFIRVESLLQQRGLKNETLTYRVMADLEVHEEVKKVESAWDANEVVYGNNSDSKRSGKVEVKVELDKEGAISKICYRLLPNTSISDGYELADPGTVFVYQGVAHEVARVESEPKPGSPEAADTPVHIAKCGLSDGWTTMSGGFSRTGFDFIVEEEIKTDWNIKKCNVCFPPGYKSWLDHF